MSFRIVTLAADPIEIDDWPLPLRSPAMGSAMLTRLVDDLRRYCQGEIAGRSYLIAGHRGAGKTTLTLRAIEDLRYELLQAARNPAQPGARRLGVQRPLMVKLHGPSLLEPLKPTKAEAAQGAGAPAAKVQGDAAAKADGDPAPKPGAGGETPRAPAASATAQSVLVQITVALYRQLAAEAALGYGLKAEAEASPLADAREVSAQLLLDLDSGAEPATLRSYWEAIDRLAKGVLWPTKCDELADARLRPGAPGLKEILALSTAGQAFRVCTGRVTHTINDTRTNSLEQQTKGGITPDIKELVGRLGTLGVGALTGAALWQANALAAVGAGALVWLLGTATLSFTFTQTRKRDKIDTYVFLPNRDVETLDRDLPVVIQRVRDAGLSPVFVVDELDKVKLSADAIADIIGRLKHIIADFGFFCFLTDRGYYDYVDARLRESPYPTEHTYFTERRLLAYGPKEYRAYLDTILQLDSEAGSDDQRAKDLLILHLIHQSCLNFADLGRELGRLKDQGILALPSEKILQRPDLQVTATAQLAIEVTLAEPANAERMARDPGFAQQITDTLYRPSRAWRDDLREYDGAKGRITEAIESRATAARAQSEREPVKQVFTPDDETALLDAHAALIERLSDFEKLRKDLADGPDEALRSKASLVEKHPDLAGLMSPKDGKAHCHTFNYSAGGRPLLKADLHVDSDVAAGLVATLEAFDALLQAEELTLADLRTGRLLPATLPIDELADAAPRLKRFLDFDLPAASVRGAYDAARTFRKLLDDLGPKLGAGLALARWIVAASQGRVSKRDAVLAHGRYPVLGEPAAEPNWSLARWMDAHRPFHALDVGATLSSAPKSITGFQTRLAERPWPTPDAVEGPGMDTRLWEIWRSRLQHFVQGVPPRIEEFSVMDLLSAALGEGAGPLLRADVANMTLLEWSRIAAAALAPPADSTPPRWVLVAALRILRFDQPALQRVATDVGPWGVTLPTAETTLAEAFARGAEADRLGALVVLDDGDHIDVNARIPEQGPAILYLPRSLADGCELGLNWLTRLDVLEVKADDAGFEA